MTRYRVQLPQRDRYRPDNRQVAEETLADLAKAFVVLLLWMGILAYLLPMLGEAIK